MAPGAPWVTVLAGGIGSRFWPASTPSRPKQLLRLASDRPLVVDTLERATALTSAGRVRILAGEHLVEPMLRVLPESSEGLFFVEPRARGTGPVLAWAAWRILQDDPTAVLVSLHSDHVVDPPDAFEDTVRFAVDLAREEALLMTVGAPPNRPEVGYGYLQPGERLTDDPSAPTRAFRVARFHEKPDRSTAQGYLDEGYLWNTGIFVWPAAVFLEEVRERAPEIGEHLHLLDEGRTEAFFDEVEAVSVDEAVLERSPRVGAVEALFQWDDVGSWEAMSRTLDPDQNGNVSRGSGCFVRSGGNVVYSEDSPVVLFGVDDLVVVRTERMTLVTRRELAPRLKELMDELPADLRNP